MMQNRKNLHSGGNDSFVCEYCGQTVLPLQNGTARNHCPACLFSKHVDNVPGDRSCGCEGLMEPAAIDQQAKKGFQVVHRCLNCGVKKKNKLALDDPRQPDDFNTVLELCRVHGKRADESSSLRRRQD